MHRSHMSNELLELMRRQWQELSRGMPTRDTQRILRQMPCGECHLADGETCNICGAYQAAREFNDP